MRPRKRLYQFTHDYDRLDRMKLVELLEQVGMPIGADDLAEMTREELMDALIDVRVEAEYDAEGAGDDYPLRRPTRLDVPDWLTDTGAGRVHLRWVEQWASGLNALMTADDQYAWPSAEEPVEGDVVVTVIACDPPVVAVVELMRDGPTGTAVAKRILVAQPMPWRDLTHTMSKRPPSTSRRLSRRAGTELRQVIAQEAADPSPHFVDAGECGPGGYSADSVAVIRVLQDATVPWGRPACSACGSHAAPGHLLAHFERSFADSVQLEIQDHVDEAALVCAPCHDILHGSSLQALRSHLRPACPACDARGVAKPIVWGMPVGSDPCSAEVVYGGCELPTPTPRWQCGSCGARYLVTAVASSPW